MKLVELAQGRLKVVVEARAVAARDCFVYQTIGLAPARKELVLKIAASKGEVEAPEAPLRFLEQSFKTLMERAPLEPGWVAPLVPRLLGFDGLGVVRRRQDDALDLVLLTKDELELASSQGLSLVLAALGAHPYPAFSEPGRATVSVGAGASLVQSGARTIPGLFVMADKNGVTLTVLEEARDLLASLLSSVTSATPLVFAAEPDPRAGQWIRDGSFATERASGAFVAFVPERVRDELELAASGVVLMLRGATWTRLRDALVSGDDLEEDLDGGKRLFLDWRDVWNDLTGTGGVGPKGKIRAVRTLVLATDDEVEQRMGFGALRAFTQKALDTARALTPIEIAHGMKLRARLRPPAVVEWVVFRPQGSRAHQLDALLSALGALKAPETRGEVSFELQLEVT